MLSSVPAAWTVSIGFSMSLLLWMDFGPGSLPGPPNAEPRSLVTFQAFKIYRGQVHAVEAIFEGMPANTPSGWR